MRWIVSSSNFPSTLGIVQSNYSPLSVLIKLAGQSCWLKKNYNNDDEKNNLHKNNAGKKSLAHLLFLTVEVSQYSNWNALLLDMIPNKTKKKKRKEPRKRPIPLDWYPPKLLATINPTEGNKYPECVIRMTPAHESAVNTSVRWAPWLQTKLG